MAVTVRSASPEGLPHVQALVRDAGLPLDGLDTAAHVFVATDDTGVRRGTAARREPRAGRSRPCSCGRSPSPTRRVAPA
jgi:hypothetical protein